MTGPAEAALGLWKSALRTVARRTIAGVAAALCTTAPWYLRLFLVVPAPNESEVTRVSSNAQRKSREIEDTCNLFI